MYVAALEEARGRAENEIHVARDVAVLEIVPATIRQDRVLPAKEAAVAERRAVAVQSDGQGLALGAGAVFEGDIFGGEIVCVNDRRRRAKSADGFAGRA